MWYSRPILCKYSCCTLVGQLCVSLKAKHYNWWTNFEQEGFSVLGQPTTCKSVRSRCRGWGRGWYCEFQVNKFEHVWGEVQVNKFECQWWVAQVNKFEHVQLVVTWRPCPMNRHRPENITFLQLGCRAVNMSVALQVWSLFGLSNLIQQVESYDVLDRLLWKIPSYEKKILRNEA